MSLSIPSKMFCDKCTYGKDKLPEICKIIDTFWKQVDEVTMKRVTEEVDVTDAYKDAWKRLKLLYPNVYYCDKHKFIRVWHPEKPTQQFKCPDFTPKSSS